MELNALLPHTILKDTLTCKTISQPCSSSTTHKNHADSGQDNASENVHVKHQKWQKI